MINPKFYIHLGLLVFSASVLNVILYHVPFSLFSYHPLLILIALVACTEGIAFIQVVPVVSSKKRTLHIVLQSIAFTAMAFGFSVIYENKARNDRPHFTTWVAVHTIRLLPLTLHDQGTRAARSSYLSLYVFSIVCRISDSLSPWVVWWSSTR